MDNYLVKQYGEFGELTNRITKGFNDLEEAMKYCKDKGKTWGSQSNTYLIDIINKEVIYGIYTYRGGIGEHSKDSLKGLNIFLL